MNDQVKLLIDALTNPTESAITIQVNKAGRVLIDYNIPAEASVDANDLAFMAANLVIGAKRVVNDVRKDVVEQGKVSVEIFDAVMADYLQEPPKEQLDDPDPMSRA